MRPSELPLRYRATMVLALVVGTTISGIVISYVVRNWIPPAIAGMLGWGVIGFFAGYITRIYREDQR